jgi:hypothetical protein
MNTTPVVPRRQPPAVTGSARVLRPIGSLAVATGEIAINGKPYLCRCLEESYELFGFDARREEVTRYQLPADLSSCDCADATFREGRPGGCKHRRALRVLVDAGKLPRLTCQRVERVDAA